LSLTTNLLSELHRPAVSFFEGQSRGILWRDNWGVRENRPPDRQSRISLPDTAFVATKFLANAASESCGTGPQINGHVEISSLHQGDEIGLRGRLDFIMQTAENSLPGARVIVLHETNLAPHCLVERPLVPRLDKKAPLIVEDARTDQRDTRKSYRLKLYVG